MVSKSEIKLVQSLRQKKFRQKYQLFAAEGDKTVTTLLSHMAYPLHKLYASSAWMERQTIGVNPRLQNVCLKEDLKKLSLLSTPSEVIALFGTNEDAEIQISDCNKVIYLDDVQDPGNVGTIIRIADWFGVDCIARSEGSADFYNPKVVQASMGSLGHVRLVTMEKESFDRQFKDYQCIGTSIDNDGHKEIVTGYKTCLVMSNEGHGLSEEIRNSLDTTIHIKGADNRQADSLNVAVATGILCQKVFAVGDVNL